MTNLKHNTDFNYYIMIIEDQMSLNQPLHKHVTQNCQLWVFNCEFFNYKNKLIPKNKWLSLTNIMTNKYPINT